MKVVALLLTAVFGNRLLDPELAFLAAGQNGQNQGNFNPLLFGDADYKDYAMYNYLQNNQGSMTPWMLNELDVDWPVYGMMAGQQQQQQASKPGIRGQVSPSAQMNPAMMQAFMQSDFGENLMDNDMAKAFFMAKMQGQQTQSRSPGFRGQSKGFGSYGGAFGGFGQPSTPTTPQYTPQFYPGMDEEMMEWQMMQQHPGSFNPAMTDWDLKDWTRYNMMMNQQSEGSAMNPMLMDGDMGDYMMWHSFMNPQQQQQSKGPRGNIGDNMQKWALCQTYLNSMSGSQTDQMQAFAMYTQAPDIGEDDVRDCMMMHQMQVSMAAAQAPAPGFDFGSGFGPRTLPDKKDMVMMAWMNNHSSGEGQGMTYYPGMDTEDMLEFNFWQKMKEQVATNQQ